MNFSISVCCFFRDERVVVSRVVSPGGKDSCLLKTSSCVAGSILGIVFSTTGFGGSMGLSWVSFLGLHSDGAAGSYFSFLSWFNLEISLLRSVILSFKDWSKFRCSALRLISIIRNTRKRTNTIVDTSMKSQFGY